MSKALDWDEISCDEIRAVIADGPVFNPETPPKVRKKRAAKSNAPADPAPANEASAEQEPGEAIEEAAEPKPDFDAEVARLAELKPLEYAHISKTEAKRLPISTHAPQAKGGNSINGGSRTEGGEQANRGARTLDASWEGRL